MNKQIVCISFDYWNGPWYRRQHFMHRFNKEGYKVAYIEPSFSMVRRPPLLQETAALNRLFTCTVKEIEKDLFIITPPRSLPLATRPFFSSLNIWYLSLHMNAALKKIGFKNYALWIYSPRYVIALRLFSYTKLIFDMVDDFTQSPSEKNQRAAMSAYTMRLARKSDILIVTAMALLEKFKKIKQQTYMVPNGYDTGLFNDATCLPVPRDIQDIPSPIIGFVGTMLRWHDFDLLHYIIKNNPGLSFVFIGRYDPQTRNALLSLINDYKNVHWLGVKKKEEIPNYINRFDVCINPFKVDEFSKSINPLKVYEYLAMRKPVVSTEMESLKKEKIGKFIYFADNYGDFNSKLHTALKEKEVFANTLDYSFVKEYSWDMLFNKVLNITEV